MNDEDHIPTRHAGYHGNSLVSKREAARLVTLCRPARRVLEIGSASGVTAAIIADACPQCLVTSIDTHGDADKPDIACWDGDRSANWRRNRRANMSLWMGDYREFAGLRPAARFDVVFCDAHHTYHETLDALTVADSLLAPGGLIVAHDHGTPAWPEVESAVSVFAADNVYAARPDVGTLCLLRPVANLRLGPCRCIVGTDPEWHAARSVRKCRFHRDESLRLCGDPERYYRSMGALDGPPHVAELEAALGPIPAGSGTALEVGGGVSNYAGKLAALGYDYLGIDPCAWACDWMTKNHPYAAMVPLPLEQAPPTPPARLILSAHSLEHMGDAPTALADMARRLAPGGLLYLVVPDDEDLWNPDHYWFFTEASLRRCVEKAGLVVEATATARPASRENFIYLRARKP